MVFGRCRKGSWAGWVGVGVPAVACGTQGHGADAKVPGAAAMGQAGPRRGGGRGGARPQQALRGLARDGAMRRCWEGGGSVANGPSRRNPALLPSCLPAGLHKELTSWGHAARPPPPPPPSLSPASLASRHTATPWVTPQPRQHIFTGARGVGKGGGLRGWEGAPSFTTPDLDPPTPSGPPVGPVPGPSFLMHAPFPPLRPRACSAPRPATCAGGEPRPHRRRRALSARRRLRLRALWWMRIAAAAAAAARRRGPGACLGPQQRLAAVATRPQPRWPARG